MTDAIEDRDHRALIDGVLDRFETDVVPRWWSLRSQVIHGDVTLDNALMDDRGRISGIIDFGDMSHSALVCDLSAALESLLLGRRPDDVVPLAMRCIDGYRSVTPLEPEELAVLPDLLSARLATVAVLFGWRARRHPDNAYLRGWEERLWPLLAYLETGGRQLLGARLRVGEPAADAPALIERRRSVFGPALSPLTYDRPLHLVRGEGVAGGRRRRAIPGLLQQRAGRRSLPSARHRLDRSPVAAAQYEHALSARRRDRAGRAIARDDAPGLGPRHGAVRELGERGQRHRVAARDGVDGRRRRARELVRLSRRDAGDHRRVARGMARWLSSRARRALRRARPVSRRQRPATAAEDLLQATERLQERGSCRRPRSSTAGSPPTGSGAAGAYARALAAHARGRRALRGGRGPGRHGRSGEGMWSFAAGGVAADLVTLASRWATGTRWPP